MKITWLGHSAFELFSHGVKILIDPFFTGNPFAGDTEAFINPDLILVTHDHGDHLGDTVGIMKNGTSKFLGIADLCSYLPSLGVDPRQIMFGGSGMNIGGTVKFAGFSITMTSAVHSAGHGSCSGISFKTLTASLCTMRAIRLYSAIWRFLRSGLPLMSLCFPLADIIRWTALMRQKPVPIWKRKTLFPCIIRHFLFFAKIRLNFPSSWRITANIPILFL